MPRTTAASAPASPAATKITSINNANIINRKSETMDKLFSIVDPAGQQVPSFGRHDDRNPYILPSFADNFEAWAYPETQQAVFEDWIATATPPCTTVASPAMEHAHMLAAGLASFPMSPSLSPPSTNLSLHSSPIVSNDIALSMASTMQQAAASVSAPIAPARVGSNASLSVVDYAAALFPDIVCSLSSTLASPAAVPSVASGPCSAGVKRALSEVSLPLSTPDAARVASWASDLAGLFDVPAPTSAAASFTASPTPEAASLETGSSGADVASMILAAPADPEAEQKRKLRDTEFLASLPPQLALKRRRTSNTKQKEKILAELLCENGAPVAKKAAVAVKNVEVVQTPAPVEADASSEDGADEPADAAALKRKKNTDAARRSRMRKILRIETLEGRVSELETENGKLAQMVAALEAEKAAMAKRMAQMESAQLQAAQFAM
ncbi:hypothetical protein LPJ75_002569 [Coemansia sp. RSA 2598]|nr:hypothetical protein LPJ75_002569 [Coemansia sp. RSA 2598]